MTQNNSSNCKYKTNVAGNAHIGCNFPLMDEQAKINIAMIMLTANRNSNLKTNFGFTVGDHAVFNGWFNFPLDFDPSWIEGECHKHSNIVGVQVEQNIKVTKLMSATKNRISEINKIHNDTNKKTNESAEVFVASKTLLEKMGNSHNLESYEEFETLLLDFNTLFDKYFTLNKGC